MRYENDFKESVVIGFIIGMASTLIFLSLIFMLSNLIHQPDTKTYVGRIDYASQNYIVITDADGKEYAFKTGGDWLAQEGSAYIIKVDGSHIISLVPVVSP